MKKPLTNFIIAQFLFYWYRDSDYCFELHCLWEEIGHACDRLMGTSFGKAASALSKFDPPLPKR